MKVDANEGSWVGSLLIIVSAIASLAGVASLFWSDPNIILAFIAGAGWTLALALFVMNYRQRQRLGFLEADLKEARTQASEWSGTANNISHVIREVFAMGINNPPVRPRHRPPHATTPDADLTAERNRDDDAGE